MEYESWSCLSYEQWVIHESPVSLWIFITYLPKDQKKKFYNQGIFLCCYRSVLVISKCNIDHTRTFIKLSVCQWTWVWWFLLILSSGQSSSWAHLHMISQNLLILWSLFYYDPFDRKGMGCVKERKSIVRPKGYIDIFCKQQLNKLLIFYYSTVDVSQSLVLLKALHFSQTAAFDNTVQYSQ